ncbi:MAG: hypothetical protein ACK559_07300, partial [bacterium]
PVPRDGLGQREHGLPDRSRRSHRVPAGHRALPVRDSPVRETTRSRESRPPAPPARRAGGCRPPPR